LPEQVIPVTQPHQDISKRTENCAGIAMQNKRILIVDDSPTTGNLIKLHVTNLGYDVAAIVGTADAALKEVNKSRPDLVLMDINLGEGMNGIEAADIIMSRHHIPVIYVTSYSDDRTLDAAKKSLPYGFINKPFRSNDLRVNIEVALSRAEHEKPQQHAEPVTRGVRDIGHPDLVFSSLSEALDHLASGVIVVNDRFEIHYKNKSAGKIMDEQFPVRISDNHLSCINSRIKKDIQHCINNQTSSVYSISHREKPVHLLIFPLTSQLSEDMHGSRGSVLFVFNTTQDSDRIEDVVRTMYKLSPTEARIAARLVFNPYLAEISSSLGITYNTARTHLKRIYQKTGTNKLPSLIQKIVTGPAGLLIHSRD